jgi:hypothetical protein
MLRDCNVLALFMLGFLVLVGCAPKFEFSSDIDSQIQCVSDGSRNAILLCCSTNTDALLLRIEREAPEVRAIALSGTDITIEGYYSISRLKHLKRIEIDTQFLLMEQVDALSNSKSLEEVIYNGSDKGVDVDVISRLRELGLASKSQ